MVTDLKVKLQLFLAVSMIHGLALHPTMDDRVGELADICRLLRLHLDLATKAESPGRHDLYTYLRRSFDSWLLQTRRLTVLLKRLRNSESKDPVPTEPQLDLLKRLHDRLIAMRRLFST